MDQVLCWIRCRTGRFETEWDVNKIERIIRMPCPQPEQ